MVPTSAAIVEKAKSALKMIRLIRKYFNTKELLQLITSNLLISCHKPPDKPCKSSATGYAKP